MRNYKVDIDELYKRIEALELENIHTERQRKRIPAKKRKEKKQPVVKDEDKTII